MIRSTVPLAQRRHLGIANIQCSLVLPQKGAKNLAWPGLALDPRGSKDPARGDSEGQFRSE